MKEKSAHSSHSNSSKNKNISRFTTSGIEHIEDYVSIEEPLEISIGYGPADQRTSTQISVTMRTPGNDFALAAGFLFTEGIIGSKEDILNIKYTSRDTEENQSFDNYIQVNLRSDLSFDEKQLSRHFYTASSCGVCGKSAIELVNKQSIYVLDPKNPQFNAQIFYQLPKALMTQQQEFRSTGGIHAAALFNAKGIIEMVTEDVGRHNAMDKLVGLCMKSSKLPLRNSGILVSGRTSFELVQKGWMAGVALIAGVGAPSSLAIELAEEAGITIIGFLSANKFNVYSCGQRIK